MKNIDCEVGAVQREINAFLEKEKENEFENKKKKENVLLKIYIYIKENSLFNFLKR